MANFLDISSKTPIISYLESLLAQKTIKSCKRLLLEKRFGKYFPKCNMDVAEKFPADNVKPFYGGYGSENRIDYSWPKCPAKCKVFKRSWRFKRHLLLSDQVHNKFRFPIQITFPITPSPKTWIETFTIFVFGMLFCYFLQKFQPLETIGAILKKIIVILY